MGTKTKRITKRSALGLAGVSAIAIALASASATGAVPGAHAAKPIRS
jgi:hypothetical protein